MRNLRDVQSVMSNQSLRYIFPFSQFSFDTEIGFLLLVEGSRSPFFTVGPLHVFICLTLSTKKQQTDTSLPLQPQDKDNARLYKDESDIKMPDQGQLETFRNLLSGARQRGKPSVPKELSEVRQIN